MICIVGASGSGKDFLLKSFEKLGFKRVISHTTRDMRQGEIDGFHYNFVTEEEFENLERQGLFAETTQYHLWKYGAMRHYCSKDAVFVIEPIGLSKLKKSGVGDIFTIKVTVDEDTRLKRIFKRGDSLAEIVRRGREFDDFEDYDVWVDNSTDRENLDEVASLLVSTFGLDNLLK